MRLTNKSIILLILSSISVFGFAKNNEPPCQAARKPINCMLGNWGFGGQALFLRPDYNNYNYIGTRPIITVNSNEQSFVRKDFEYQFGFKLETFSQITNTMDLNLNWYHYNVETRQDLPAGINVFGNTFAGRVVTLLNPDWDAVNLEVGNLFNINSVMQLRLHMGLQYADIGLEQRTAGSDRSTGNTQLRTDRSTYKGGGVRGGADITYQVSKGLSVYTNLGAGLLTGTQRFSRESTTNTNPQTFTSDNGASTTTVEELEGKLGLSSVSHLTTGDLVFDIGWMWVNYFNAIQFANANGRTDVSNFTEQGLYFGLKWDGDIL